MYRVGKKAFAHGNYIRPNYVAVWREAQRQAEDANVSLSEFISHALYIFMTGHEPKDGKLEGPPVMMAQKHSIKERKYGT